MSAKMLSLWPNSSQPANTYANFRSKSKETSTLWFVWCLLPLYVAACNIDTLEFTWVPPITPIQSWTIWQNVRFHNNSKMSCLEQTNHICSPWNMDTIYNCFLIFIGVWLVVDLVISEVAYNACLKYRDIISPDFLNVLWITLNLPLCLQHE